MKKCALFVMVFLLALSVRAQEETPQYRLRVPTAEEYLAEMPDFSALDLQGYEAQNDAARIVLVAEAEFLLKYSQSTNFEVLSRAYDQFSIGIFSAPHVATRLPSVNLNKWNALVLQEWLRENPTELDAVQTIQFGDYVITIQPRDFTGDGQHEWLLDVSKGLEAVTYHNYLVATHHDNSYLVHDVPITWMADGFSTDSPQGNPLSEVQFADINADGIPEWVLIRRGSSSGLGYWFDHSYTSVFEWQNNRIVRLAFIDGSPTFENYDRDDPLEILNTRVQVDSWGCGYSYTDIYDWNRSTYISIEPQIESLDCTARHAEEAMWAGDFSTAVSLYETFIASHQSAYDEYLACTRQCDCACGNRDILIFDYFLVRRIIAYASLGNSSRVESLLAELQMTPHSITGFAEALINADSIEASAICQAAYDYYATYQPSLTGATEAEIYTFIPGVVIEAANMGYNNFLGLQINPVRAGCDINALNGTPIPTVTPTYTPYPTLLPPTPDTRSQESVWIDEQEVYEAFRAGSYETVLTITQTPAVQDESQGAEMRYYRALALEMLNRPDEALAQYVAIYSAAPESAWGQLAALHLERVD